MVDVGAEVLLSIRKAAIISEPAQRNLQVRGPRYAVDQGLLNAYVSPSKLEEVVVDGTVTLGSLIAAQHQMTAETAYQNSLLDAGCQDVKGAVEQLRAFLRRLPDSGREETLRKIVECIDAIEALRPKVGTLPITPEAAMLDF